MQVHNSGSYKSSPPNQSGLDAWISTYGSAHATGMDPKKRCSKYYLKYSASKGAFTGSIPNNLLIDAKTMKVLARGVSYSSLPSQFGKYLP